MKKIVKPKSSSIQRPKRLKQMALGGESASHHFDFIQFFLTNISPCQLNLCWLK